MADVMRLDKFLKVSRLIKRRTVANEACDGGHVSVNGKIAKASVDVKEGDIVAVQLQTEGKPYTAGNEKEISEEELWNSKPQVKISEEDLALLRAVKTIASRPQTEDKAQDPAQSAALSSKDKERSR